MWKEKAFHPSQTHSFRLPAMDRWKYYDIIHQRHTVMNSVDETKLENLYDRPIRPTENSLDTCKLVI